MEASIWQPMCPVNVHALEDFWESIVRQVGCDEKQDNNLDSKVTHINRQMKEDYKCKLMKGFE